MALINSTGINNELDPKFIGQGVSSVDTTSIFNEIVIELDPENQSILTLTIPYPVERVRIKRKHCNKTIPPIYFLGEYIPKKIHFHFLWAFLDPDLKNTVIETPVYVGNTHYVNDNNMELVVGVLKNFIKNNEVVDEGIILRPNFIHYEDRFKELMGKEDLRKIQWF